MAIVVSVRPLLQHRSQRDPTVDCAPSTRPHGSARSGHCSLECMHNPASSVPRTALCSADPNLNRTHARTHARTHTLSTRASTCMPKPATSRVPPPPPSTSPLCFPCAMPESPAGESKPALCTSIGTVREPDVRVRRTYVRSGYAAWESQGRRHRGGGAPRVACGSGQLPLSTARRVALASPRRTPAAFPPPPNASESQPKSQARRAQQPSILLMRHCEMMIASASKTKYSMK